MNTQRLWFQVTAFLLLVWGGVAAVMWLTEDSVFTPEKTLVLMNAAPWYENERLGPRQRGEHLDKVIASVIKLDLSQRDHMREDGAESVDRFLKSLTDPEKGEYISRVVENTFATVMRGLAKLPLEERRRITRGIQNDLKKRENKSSEMQMLVDQSPENFENTLLKDSGLFFKEAPLDAKLNMAPMLEGMQARMQMLRR